MMSAMNLRPVPKWAISVADALIDITAPNAPKNRASPSWDSVMSNDAFKSGIAAA